MNAIVAVFLAGIVIFSVFITVLLGMTFIATTMVFLISTMFLLVLLILVGSKTRAFEELTAALKKKTIMEFWAPNRKVYRLFADSIGMGKVVDVKGVGNILVTKDSIYTDSKTGAPQAMVIGELGVTSPPKLLAAAQKMNDSGFEDIEHVISEVIDDDGNISKDIKIPISEANAILDSHGVPAPDGAENPGRVGKLITTIKNETVRVSDFLRFFKYEVTPASIKYVIEKTIADRMEGNKAMQMKWAFVIIALIMAGAVAAIMLFTFAPGSQAAAATPDQIKSICAATCQTIQQAASPGLVG